METFSLLNVFVVAALAAGVVLSAVFHIRLLRRNLAPDLRGRTRGLRRWRH